MKVEIVKTVVEEYELTEKDAIKVIEDYGGDVKEYIRNEMEPYDVDETIGEVNYNIDELRSIESKIKNFSPKDWFIKYSSSKISCKNKKLNGAVNPTEEQMKLIKTLMPFTHKHNSNFGLEFQGVRLFKDYAEASDLTILIRINTDTGLPDEIGFSLVGEAALEFDRKDILLCKNTFAVKVDNECLISSNLVEGYMDTHKKLNVDKNKGKDINLYEIDTSGELCVIGNKQFRSKYIAKVADILGSSWKHYIEDDVLKLYSDNIEIYLSAVLI